MQDTQTSQAMVGDHPLMRDLLQLARRVALSDLAVNLFGETGTGKELLARLIHAESPRWRGPFVSVDCGMLAIETARSDLFGHVRGAFTGAQFARCGLVAEADGGTLFLDEIGELHPDLQLQLLRLIQEGEYRCMGESKVRRANVRLIAATHQDLESLVEKKRFRSDLYYRLQMVPLTLPPLRARRSDVPLLIDHFMALYQAVGYQKQMDLSARAVLCAYDWPGNIRELQHEIARLVVMADGPLITLERISDRIRSANPSLDVYDLPFKDARKQQLLVFMNEYIHRQLLRSGGNVTLAARESGVGRQYFQMRMAECGLCSKKYKRVPGGGRDA